MAKTRAINWKRVYRRITNLWRELQEQVGGEITVRATALDEDGHGFVFRFHSRVVRSAWAAVEVPTLRVNAIRTDLDWEHDIATIIESAKLGLQIAEMHGRHIESQRESPEKLAAEWN